ncbi:uncharacterized protein LOC102721783 [Oryza brachyantha]|uniref:uncharacterized protein LOC102721783 n=1 Tax=Oryza brachyantha TaxID=4533 RepID=UPI001ADA8C64|nr:uncharacterized protein LOC102721783 [Oryza brachyantha]
MAIKTAKRKGKEEEDRDWATAMPADLSSFDDFLNCLSWERARPLPAIRERVPWLLLAVKAEQSYLRRLTPPSQGQFAALQLPGRHVRRGRREICLGSSRGWLVTANDFGCARVVNPLTGAAAPLPPLWTLPYLEAVHSSDGCVESFLYQDEHHRGGRGAHFSFEGLCDLVLLKAVVVDIGGGGATVAVLYRKQSEFAIARTGRRQRSWTLVHNGLDTIVDMKRHDDGKIYTVHLSGNVARWKIDCVVTKSPEIQEVTRVIDSSYHYVVKDNGKMSRVHERDGDDRAGECSYLAGAPNGKLYLLKRVYKHRQVGGQTQRSTAAFSAWFLRQRRRGRGGMKWVSNCRDDILGDLTAFVSCTGSVCVHTKKKKKKNALINSNSASVYFTEESVDYLGAAMVDSFGVSRTNVVPTTTTANHTMKEDEERETKTHQVKKLGRCMNWPPPFWFVPSLQGF